MILSFPNFLNIVHCVYHLFAHDHFGIETKQITTIFQLVLLWKTYFEHQGIDQFVEFLSVIVCLEAFSDSSTTRNIFGTATIHLSRACGFSVNPTAPPSPLFN